MSGSYISTELRREVIKRAGNCCKYCLLGQENSTFPYHVDHIISEQHGGETKIENLCLSCPDCNIYKGPNISSYDRDAETFTGFYNPRKQEWSEHFRLENDIVEPLTPEGRVTVFLLRLNHPDRVTERHELIELGRYPCAASLNKE